MKIVSFLSIVGAKVPIGRMIKKSFVEKIPDKQNLD